MKNNIYTLLLAMAAVTGISNNLQAQCTASVSPPTTVSQITNAYNTDQSFTPTCTGHLTGITFKFCNYSDDFRGSHAFLRCNLKNSLGTVVGKGIWPNGKDTTDVIFPNNTLTASFACNNISLNSGTKYMWELEAVQDMPNIIPAGGVILFSYTAADVYSGGNYIADGVQKTANDIQGWTVNISDGNVVTANAIQTQIITPCTSFYNAMPQLIANVQPGATNGISGSTTAKVWIESSQPSSYVKRHYEITPATNASTATGKVTLYFTQAEFDAFNAVNTLKLPSSSSDATGKANLRIEKRGGTSGNGTGLPNSYTGSVTNIDPADADIVWNSAVNRWEVSFDVIGFSGFFVKTNPSLLPLQWLKVNATLNSIGYAQVVWQVQEAEIQAYTIERSDDGRNFVPAGEANSKGNGTNSYLFTEATPLKGTAYYRIKQTGRDGKISYSETMRLSGNNFDLISVYPNPFTTTITLQSNASQTASVLDASGRLVQTLGLKPGTTTINSSQWSKGIYTLQVANGETIKLIKE